MRTVFLLVGAAAAAMYCEDARETFGIDVDDCHAIHTEYMNMLKSGKTLEAIAADLKADEAEDEVADGENAMSNDQAMVSGDEGDLAFQHEDPNHPDSDMSCARSCSQGAQSCGICVNLRNQNSCCRRRKNSTRKSITYGGYVKSHILIQCYGMIDEGCRRLPTWHSGCYKVCGGCSDSCNNSSCGCASTCQSSTSACGCKCSATNFRRYLHCVGRRVSRCYRTKIIHTRQVCHAKPTTR